MLNLTEANVRSSALGEMHFLRADIGYGMTDCEHDENIIEALQMTGISTVIKEEP
jgi:hypothetical protein